MNCTNFITIKVKLQDVFGNIRKIESNESDYGIEISDSFSFLWR